MVLEVPLKDSRKVGRACCAVMKFVAGECSVTTAFCREGSWSETGADLWMRCLGYLRQTASVVLGCFIGFADRLLDHADVLCLYVGPGLDLVF